MIKDYFFCQNEKVHSVNVIKIIKNSSTKIGFPFYFSIK